MSHAAANFSKSESMLEHAASMHHEYVRIRLIKYAGRMDFHAYCNGVEFIALVLDDSEIPDLAYQTHSVSAYAYQKSEVEHNADSFIGNWLVHGDGARLDTQINNEIQGWWNVIKARFLNLRYVNSYASPATAKTGDNRFDVSISNLSSLAACTFVVEIALPNQAIIPVVLIELTNTRPGFGQSIILS